jgi:hypothetical protein
MPSPGLHEERQPQVSHTKSISCISVKSFAFYTDVTSDQLHVTWVAFFEVTQAQIAETSPQCRNAILLSPNVFEIWFPVQS